MKPLRVLVLVHEDLVPPDTVEGVDLTTAGWRTEYEVVHTLRELGHEVRPLGVQHELAVVRQVVDEWKPHIAFNLLEEFSGVAIYDQNVVSYLELLKVPYTGCNPRGLMLARDKGLAKKILYYHRIPIPEFITVPLGRSVKRPKELAFPLIVNSVSEEASLGISQASIVEDDDKLQERVKFIHQSLGTGALVERYIEGREVYVGVMGHHRLQVFPVWELDMSRLPDEAKKIATARVYPIPRSCSESSILGCGGVRMSPRPIEPLRCRAGSAKDRIVSPRLEVQDRQRRECQYDGVGQAMGCDRFRHHAASVAHVASPIHLRIAIQQFAIPAEHRDADSVFVARNGCEVAHADDLII